jgi:hypothetical protein
MSTASRLANDAHKSLLGQRTLLAKSNRESEWVFRSPEYKMWLSCEGPDILWISGPPNSGKTQAFVEVLNDISSRRFDRSSELIPAVYFCRKELQNPDNSNSHGKLSNLRSGNDNLLRSIIAQIMMINVQRASSFRRAIINSSRDQASASFLAFVEETNSLDGIFEHLWELFRQALEYLSPEYVFIDGLDKLDERTTLLRKLLSHWQPSKSGTRTKLLVTARPYIDIQRDLADVPVIDENSERKRKQDCIAM